MEIYTFHSSVKKQNFHERSLDPILPDRPSTLHRLLMIPIDDHMDQFTDCKYLLSYLLMTIGIEFISNSSIDVHGARKPLEPLEKLLDVHH